MSKLLDGPAAGTYLVHRAPFFLRAVRNLDGECDLLDQLDDVPERNEAVSVYRLVTEPITVHFNFGGGKGGWYEGGYYRYMPEVEGELLRETETWRDWVVKKVTAMGYYVDPETGSALREEGDHS